MVRWVGWYCCCYRIVSEDTDLIKTAASFLGLIRAENHLLLFKSYRLLPHKFVKYPQWHLLHFFIIANANFSWARYIILCKWLRSSGLQRPKRGRQGRRDVSFWWRLGYNILLLLLPKEKETISKVHNCTMPTYDHMNMLSTSMLQYYQESLYMLFKNGSTFYDGLKNLYANVIL